MRYTLFGLVIFDACDAYCQPFGSKDCLREMDRQHDRFIPNWCACQPVNSFSVPELNFCWLLASLSYFLCASPCPLSNFFSQCPQPTAMTCLSMIQVTQRMEAMVNFSKRCSTIRGLKGEVGNFSRFDGVRLTSYPACQSILIARFFLGMLAKGAMCFESIYTSFTQWWVEEFWSIKAGFEMNQFWETFLQISACLVRSRLTEGYSRQRGTYLFQICLEEIIILDFDSSCRN